MLSRVEMIPKKTIVRKCWKNSGFLIVYPTANTMGGSKSEKKKSFEKMIYLSKIYIQLMCTNLRKRDVINPRPMATVD